MSRSIIIMHPFTFMITPWFTSEERDSMAQRHPCHGRHVTLPPTRSAARRTDRLGCGFQSKTGVSSFDWLWQYLHRLPSWQTSLLWTSSERIQRGAYRSEQKRTIYGERAKESCSKKTDRQKERVSNRENEKERICRATKRDKLVVRLYISSLNEEGDLGFF